MNRRVASLGHRSALRRPRNVLVGSGLDDRSDDVVAAAAALAGALQGRLCVLHVAELDASAVTVEAGWLEPAAYESLSNERQSELRAQVERLQLDPAPHTLQVAFGNPERALLQAAAAVGADIIVVGAARSGRAWVPQVTPSREGVPQRRLARLRLPGRLIGSTTTALVRRAPCPVLVVRPPLQVPPRRVVAPVDLSMLAADSFRCGVHVLEALTGHEGTAVEALLVLRVLESEIAPRFGADQVEKLARTELERFIEESRGTGDMVCEARLRIGDAASEILAEVAENDADLIVIGTHGTGGFVPGSTGSVTQAVVRRAPCSVLVVPPIASLGTAIAAAVQEQTAPL